MSMEGLLPHIAAPAYPPSLFWLSGNVKVCHKMVPERTSNLDKLPRKVQHCPMPRSSSSEDLPTKKLLYGNEEQYHIIVNYVGNKYFLINFMHGYL